MKSELRLKSLLARSFPVKTMKNLLLTILLLAGVGAIALVRLTVWQNVIEHGMNQTK